MSDHMKLVMKKSKPAISHKKPDNGSLPKVVFDSGLSSLVAESLEDADWSRFLPMTDNKAPAAFVWTSQSPFHPFPHFFPEKFLSIAAV